MQQVDQDHTEAPMSPLVDGSPAESLTRCAGLVRFLGAAVSAIEVGGGGMNREDSATVCMLADMAADAIEWERNRMRPAFTTA